MSGPYLLGLDAGGGSGRALLIDAEARPVASARRAWSHRPAPDSGGLGIDLDLEAIWSSLGAAAREAIERAGARPEEVAGVAASAIRFGLVLLDGAGAVLHAGANTDGRGTGVALELAVARGAALHARCGHWPAPVLAAPRLRWLASTGLPPTAHALSVSDWMAWRLCGELASDPTQASTTGLFDLDTADWARDLAAELEVPPGWLPPLVPVGARLGALRDDAAGLLGLPPGTPVAMGAADSQCGLLATGGLEPGQVGVVAGTTAPVQLVTAHPLRDAEGRTWSQCHVLPGRWVLESNAGPLGQTLEWVADLLFPDAALPVPRLLGEAARTRPGAAGTTLTVGAGAMDARSLSLPVTQLGFTPLPTALDADRNQLVARAAVEGCASAVRANVEQLRAIAGEAERDVLAVGGLTRSETWPALLAEILGRPVQLGATPEGTAQGAALCAGVAAGVWSDVAEAGRSAARHLRSVEPDAERSAVYADLYPRWRELGEAQAGAQQLGSMLLTPAAVEARGAAAPTETGELRPRILVTADLDESGLDALRALGEVEYASFREVMRLLTGPALVEALAGFDVFVTEVDLVGAAALAALPDLRVVATCRSDAVNVDVEACSAYGVPVLHTPGRNAAAVADLTVGFALMLARRLPEAAAFLRQPGIEPGDMGKMGQAFGALQGRELGGKTVGLVGLGAVGRGVARRLRSFGARVLVHDPFVSAEQAARCDAEAAALDELLARSDLVSLHAPGGESTRGLIGREALARMKPGAFLVNTARAALVDEDALIDALASGHLAGAALDVFGVEPPGSEHPLLRFENVIATPHVGGNTREVGGHQGRILAGDLARLLRGEAPRHALDPAALEGFDWHAPRREADPARLARIAERPPPSVSDLQRDAAAPAAQASGARPGEAAAADVPAAVLETMRGILRAFVDGCVADAALAAFARDCDVTLHFTLTDLGLDFFLRLRGELSGDVGAPDATPEVDLKLSADVFDGMFTGRVNPMQAAMSGRLSFTGDAAKAMTLQHLQADLSRLYRAARDAVGDPGDLSTLGGPAPAAAVAPPDDDDVRCELVRVVDELYGQELITATGGNVSARVPGHDELWITPSQLFKGDLRPGMLVRLDLDGKPLDARAPSPSSERLMHCAVYRARPEAMAVVHAHAPNATILANTGLPFLPISTEAAFFGEIPRVPFIMPGTGALADAVEQAARESWAVLLVNHGLLVAGRSLRRAADMAEIIERSAEVILGCYAVGREPPTLPDDVVATLREMGDLVA